MRRRYGKAKLKAIWDSKRDPWFLAMLPLNSHWRNESLAVLETVWADLDLRQQILAERDRWPRYGSGADNTWIEAQIARLHRTGLKSSNKNDAAGIVLDGDGLDTMIGGSL